MLKMVSIIKNKVTAAIKRCLRWSGYKQNVATECNEVVDNNASFDDGIAGEEIVESKMSEDEINPVNPDKVIYTECIPYIHKNFNFNDVKVELDCAKCDYEKSMYRIEVDEQTWGYLRLCTTQFHSNCLRNEVEMLRYLKEKSISFIPTVIAQEDINKSISFSIVTALKHDEITEIPDCNIIIDGLDIIREKTTVHIDFEESDFYKTLQAIDDRIYYEYCTDEWKNLADYIHMYMNKYKGKKCDFAFSHRDVKNDNYYIYENKLYLFDFEGSRKTYPLYFDYFYYFIFTYGFNEETIEKLKEFSWYSPQGVKEFLLDLLSRTLVADTLSSHFHKIFVEMIFSMWKYLD